MTLPDWPGEYLHILELIRSRIHLSRLQSKKSGRESFDTDAWFGDPKSLTVAKKFADAHRLKLGDPIRVKFGEREIDLVLRSFLETKDGDSHFAAMDIGWAQELFGLQGKLTQTLFQISDPNNPEPVRERIRN